MTDDQRVRALFTWATQQPWWRFAWAGAEAGYKALICVPSLPAELVKPERLAGGMVMAAMQHRTSKATIIVTEDPKVTSWYLTMADKDCAPLEDPVDAMARMIANQTMGEA